METIEIIESINKDKILTENYLKKIDIGKYLDSRDNSKAFEKKLLDAFKAVENIDNSEIKDYEELSKLIFKKLTRIIGITDLSCYVAEDFEIILKNLHNQTSNEFLTTMLSEYESGKLPSA